MNIKLIIFLTFISGSCFSQNNNYIPYYQKIAEASSLSSNNKFQKADSIFKIAFQMVTFAYPDDYIKAAENSCKMNNFFDTKKYLSKTIFMDYPLKKIKMNKKLKLFIKSKHWKNLKQEFKKNHKNMGKKYGRLFNKINKMSEDDQKYRGKNYSKNIEKQRGLDSLNLIKIKQLQKQYGKIPGIKETGYQGMMLLYIIFRHVDEQYSISTLGPQLIKQSKKGDFPPNFGPEIIDYKAVMQVSSNKYRMTCQIYGTTFMNLKNKKILIPIRNKENVNTLRNSIGLPPIDDSKYNEEYVKKHAGGRFEFCK